MKNNQYALYRIKINSQCEQLRNLPYLDVIKQKLSIRIENYKMVKIGSLLPTEQPMALRKRIKSYCKTSDVLVLNQNGTIQSYYNDEEGLHPLSGFVRLNQESTYITLDTENYQIAGKNGSWMIRDCLIIDGQQFYLMEHQIYHRNVPWVIIDHYGKIVFDENTGGFNSTTKDRLHEYMQSLMSSKKEKSQSKSWLIQYQNCYKNELQKKTQKSTTDKAKDKGKNQNNIQNKQIYVKKNMKPEKRSSVIKRLHEKQIAIAIRSGKPVPKYLETERERRF